METMTGDGSAAQARFGASAGDLEVFIAQHYRRLLALAGLVCGDSGSAEDIVQSALERAWRARGTLREDDRLRAWLDRIVVREAARERRVRLRWHHRVFRPPVVTDIAAEPTRDIADVAATRFTDRSAMRMAFASLSRPQRAVVALTMYAGYSIDETAALLEIPRDTVRSRLRAARERLRDALGEVG